jgi:hypothetical protein
MGELLVDTTWWNRWLPRLYEILGRADAGVHYLDSDGRRLGTTGATPT